MTTDWDVLLFGALAAVITAFLVWLFWSQSRRTAMRNFFLQLGNRLQGYASERLQRLSARAHNARRSSHDGWRRLQDAFRRDVRFGLRLIAIIGSFAFWTLLALGAFGGVLQFIALALVAITLGPLLALFAVVATPFVGPPLIEKLTIKPNDCRPDGWIPGHTPYPASYSGLFTDLEPGRVKIKIAGFDRFITCLMAWQGRHFMGEEDNPFTTDHQEYWEVVKEDPNTPRYPDSHPLPFPEPKGQVSNTHWWLWLTYVPFSVAFWVFTRWTYYFTGAVWIGIPGYRTIRIYWLDRWEKVQDAHGNPTLERKADWSDHYRVAEFQFGVIVPKADTQNMVEVEVQLNQICAVFNPYLVAFNTGDKWGQRLNGVNTNATNLYTRSRPAKEVIAAKSSDTADEFTQAVTEKANEKTLAFGIHVVETQLLDVSPTDKELQSQLAEPARAQARFDAAELDAKAQAAPVNAIGAALREYPEAMHIPGLETMVRTANAAGDKAIVFLGNTEGTQPLSAAMIKELRELKTITPPAAIPPAANPGGTGP